MIQLLKLYIHTDHYTKANTNLSKQPGTTLVSPTAYLALTAPFSAISNIQISGICQEIVISSRPSNTMDPFSLEQFYPVPTTVPTDRDGVPDVDERRIPPIDWWISIGFLNSSNTDCTNLLGAGEPFANIPVLSLTSYSTVILDSVTTSDSNNNCNAEPSCTLPTISSSPDSYSAPIISTVSAKASPGGSVSHSLPFETTAAFPTATWPSGQGPSSSYEVLGSPPNGQTTVIYDSSILSPINHASVSTPVLSMTYDDIPFAFSDSNIVVGTQTLIAGGPALSFQSIPVSLATFPTALYIDSSLISLQPAPAPKSSPNDIIIGTSTISADAASAFIINGQTLTPGGNIVVSGNTISYGSSVVVIAGSTQALYPASQPTAALVLAFDSLSWTANFASAFVIGSQTLTPGGSITVSGAVLSLLPSAVVVAGSTYPLSGDSDATTPPVLTFGTELVTADPSGGFVIGSQTLLPGGSITVSGAVLSLLPSATAIVITGSTFDLSSGNLPLTPGVLTVGTNLVTANPSGAFVVDSKTLTPGDVITVAGTVISLESGGSVAVVGGQTEVLSTKLTGSSTVNIGGLIWSALGGAPGGAAASSKTTEGVLMYTGRGANKAASWGVLFVPSIMALGLGLSGMT